MTQIDNLVEDKESGLWNQVKYQLYIIIQV
jgi:hypothetical protein